MNFRLEATRCLYENRSTYLNAAPLKENLQKTDDAINVSLNDFPSVSHLGSVWLFNRASHIESPVFSSLNVASH